ncbi:putative RNA-directed DNA polymerase [Helianthus debilis subsp. tardiflorus]
MAEETHTFQAPSVPRFDGDYDHWSLVMETLLRSKEYWVVIENGFKEPREGEQLTPTQRTNLEVMRLKDLKARNYLFQSIDKQILKTITQKDSAKKIWDAMKVKYHGNARVKRAQLQRHRREFETLEMKEGEGVAEYLSRVMVVANDMRNCGEDMPDVKIVEKVLRSLTVSFNFVVCLIEESKDIDTLSFDELQSSLLVHEQKLKCKAVVEEQVLKVENDSSVGRGRGRGRGVSNRGRGRGRGRSQFDKALVECYKCHQKGHFQYECPNGDRAVNYAEYDDHEELLLMAAVDIEKYEKEALLLMASVDDGKLRKENIWFLDSACSNHMTGTRDWFIHLDESYKHSVRLGNDLRLEVKGVGDIRLEVEGRTQVITNVYFVPQLTSNLISVGQLQDKAVTFIIQGGKCEVFHPQKGLIFTSKMSKNRMFPVIGARSLPQTECLQVSEDQKSQIWHRRFAHVNHKAIRTMQYKKMVKDLPTTVEKYKVCEICAIGKQQREAIPKKSEWRAKERLELIHTDLCGPITPASHSGRRYVLVFIDDFTRKTWVYFLSHKGEAFELFKTFKSLVENETGLKIKCLRSDKGGEFTSSSFKAFCELHGIKRQLTAAYTPQQNGVAERRNRTIMNMVRWLLAEKSMPKYFWSEAARWACHVLNRCISRSLDDKVPEEMWTGIKPSVEHFKVFGCVVYAHIPAQLRTKLDARSHKCVFLGVSQESKAYRLYDPAVKKIVISRDVLFDEEGKWDWKTEETKVTKLIIGEEEASTSANEVHAEEVNSPLIDQMQSTPSQADSPNSPEQGGCVSAPMAEQSSQAEPSSRIRKPPVWMNDYQTGEELLEEETTEDEAGFAMYSSLDDPTTYEEACKEERWIKAMENEIAAIEQNHTWELVKAPVGVKPIGVKWVFKTKFNEQGKVDKYKARLVVKGYAQKRGVDYNEVFAPVARWDTIRSFLAMAAQKDWSVFQMDVKSAFLHGELKEIVYVNQPQGFIKPGEEAKVYRLRKALYGLKQAPRAWFNRIENYFKREGFKKSSYDHTLFIKTVWEKIIIVSLYVDDLIYAGNDITMCESFKQSIQREFEMTDLGQMRFFLGIEVHQSNLGISLCQSQYAKAVLERFRMWESNSVNNPIVKGTVLTKAGVGEEVDATAYKRLVGSLMYLTVTRPDISYVVGLLSRFMGNPRKEHLLIAKRVLRYIKGTLNYGLQYGKRSVMKLRAYTDSDYARDTEDRRCTSGYVCLLSGAAICWSSRKQDIVTLSSTEAEYVAATACACHCVWLKGLLADLGIESNETLEIICDKSSTIKLSKNSVMHRRTKHIDVRFHYLRDLVNQEVVKLEFCRTEDQIADIMTKPLKLDDFIHLRKQLGVQEIKQDG